MKQKETSEHLLCTAYDWLGKWFRNITLMSEDEIDVKEICKILKEGLEGKE